MQPIGTSTLSPHVNKQKQQATRPSGKPRTGNALKYPEDIVNLSTSQTQNQASPHTRSPSIPVSSKEKDALLNSFSNYKSLSIYA